VYRLVEEKVPKARPKTPDGEEQPGKEGEGKGGKGGKGGGTTLRLAVILEENPKWRLLSRVLKEIEEKHAKNGECPSACATGAGHKSPPSSSYAAGLTQK
jgi:hypothetical protein